MGILWSILIGGLIGWAAGAITKRDIPYGILGNIIAGIVGANLGMWIFGAWGPRLGGFALIPALVGAIILVLVTSAVLRAIKK
ncbi:GlsB/YeaQ/YmgE family stress response membrane protein [Shouchella lonarensis]|uniref:Uncharacterized membrane protein YeaQ/YmgE, transglycosylase-associated protein family n=1 Tax=Shouchella lonarensis TaxID=1464122 RepID=A0A1G6P3Z6_9BACI|nr:GlsB/YeaQ/YmgE family stress response membrane protein [Shouchella lonarensis]SDC74903.1 Uncharacterized membrane protein YeaQ/YmgE, transglycosylase-associated protein family [Shouchella lonarensis]